MEYPWRDNLAVESKSFHLSTRGDAGTLLNGDKKSVIQFNILDAIVQDETIEYIYFSIPYCVIPISFYIINNGYNTLTVLENGLTTNYVFPSGNYNASYFMTTFATILPSRFSITLNNVNNKFTISNTTNSFTCLGITTIEYIIGFSGDTPSNGLVLSMPRVCNFLPLTRITMRCAKIGGGFMASSVNSTDTILTIQNNAKLNGQIIYENLTSNNLAFQSALIAQNFHISAFIKPV